MVRGIRSLIRPIITPLTFESFFIRVHSHMAPQVGTCCPCIITMVAFEFSNFQMFCVHMLPQLCFDIFIVTVRIFTFNLCMFSIDVIIKLLLRAQHDNLAGWAQMTCEWTVLVIVNVKFQTVLRFENFWTKITREFFNFFDGSTFSFLGFTKEAVFRITCYLFR